MKGGSWPGVDLDSTWVGAGGGFFLNRGGRSFVSVLRERESALVGLVWEVWSWRGSIGG